MDQHTEQLGILTKEGRIRLAPFDPDRCGGFGFLADLILSPTVSALLVSSLAFFGVAYTHRAFDISTVTGILVQLAILVVFYAIPTFLLRLVLRQVKKTSRIEVHLQQEVYYQAILAGGFMELLFATPTSICGISMTFLEQLTEFLIGRTSLE